MYVFTPKYLCPSHQTNSIHLGRCAFDTRASFERIKCCSYDLCEIFKELRGRRELTANPEESNIFSLSISGEPTQIMRRKFIEYLGTDCFHFCRIPVELSVVSASNTNRTKPSSNMQCTDNDIYM
jgi:hypothetical protein